MGKVRIRGVGIDFFFFFFGMKSYGVGKTLRMWKRLACSWGERDLGVPESLQLGGNAGREVQVTGKKKKK